jgi:hypothetical protein
MDLFVYLGEASWRTYEAIGAAGRSLERFLTHCFSRTAARFTSGPTSVVLVRTEDLAPDECVATCHRFSPALSIFLYKLETNKSMRAAWAHVGHQDQRSHLPLDLHYLLTPWADNAYNEHCILGRAMQCLEQTPILSGPLLDSTGRWATSEALQVCLEDLATEDVMRTFDSLPADYKVSVGYLARIVRIDSPANQRHRPVTRSVTGLLPTIGGRVVNRLRGRRLPRTNTSAGSGDRSCSKRT